MGIRFAHMPFKCWKNFPSTTCSHTPQFMVSLTTEIVHLYSTGCDFEQNLCVATQYMITMRSLSLGILNLCFTDQLSLWIQFAGRNPVHDSLKAITLNLQLL